MSNLNDEVCKFNFTPTTENFAGQNGHGIVYNKSDCSRGYVRFYGNGGDAPGSVCWQWIPGYAMDFIHNNDDHNWTSDELNNAGYNINY